MVYRQYAIDEVFQEKIPDELSEVCTQIEKEFKKEHRLKLKMITIMVGSVSGWTSMVFVVDVKGCRKTIGVLMSITNNFITNPHIPTLALHYVLQKTRDLNKIIIEEVTG